MNEMYDDWNINGMPGEYVFSEGEFYNVGHEDERWKRSELPGVLVSDQGRFFDADKRHFVKPTHGDREGHKAVKITKNGKHLQKYAHRLIANAFIPNPNNLPEVRHLNDCPSDNEIENLAWGTHSDNVRDAIQNGRTYTASVEIRDKSLESVRKPVKATNENTGKELYFRSVNDAARGTGAQQANVCKVLSGIRSRTVGHKYEYISKEEYNEKRSN